MRVHFNSFGASALWPIPLFTGLLLLACGVLIIVFPAILAYAVAALFLMAGLSMIGFAIGLRRATRGGPMGGMAWPPRDDGARTVIVEEIR
jgi:uncharacterized membrane protein HdeD (DUF308 family)